MKTINKFFTTNLGSIAKVLTGPFGSQLHEKDYVEKGTPIITVEHLGYGRIIKNDIPCVSESDVLRLKKFLLKTGDIVFSRVGSVDRSVLIRDEEDGWMFSGRCLRVRLTTKDVLPAYLYYYFTQNSFRQYVRNNAVGATMPSLNSSILRRLKILYPSLSKQIQINDILSTIDDTLANNHRRTQLLEEAARLLFREWFVYFRFPGHEKAKFDDRDGILIPAGWEYLPITKVKIFKKIKVGVPVFIDTRQYYQTSEIDGTNLVGSGEEVDYENRPSRADVVPRLNSVYFAKMKDTDKVAYFNKGNAELLEKILLSTGMAGFSTDEKYLAFLFGLLTSYEFVQNKNNYATGATQVSLSDGGLKKIKVILPKLELIEKYSSIVNPFLEECSYLRAQNQKLAQARDLLLPRLMSGKIEV
jgi:type I restriction enzyme, S subunit